MNFSEALGREVFRPFATTIVPGAVALAPYALLLGLYHPVLADLARSNAAATSALLLISTVAVGFVLEDFGAWIEQSLWDPILSRRRENHAAMWYRYLSLSFEADREPIGQHYLRTVLLRFKFELSFSVSIAIALPGFVWFAIAARLLDTCGIALGVVLGGCLAGYLVRESFDSAEVLGKIRWLLVDSNAIDELTKRPPPKEKSWRPTVLAGVAWATYLLWEAQVRFRWLHDGNCAHRVDLLAIGPLLVWLTWRAYRSLRPQPGNE